MRSYDPGGQEGDLNAAVAGCHDWTWEILIIVILFFYLNEKLSCCCFLIHSQDQDHLQQHGL